ncbi:MAG TPA: glycosyltransferase [Mycobacteriales bacterium]|nr:glycosyltransferase [Mycobacteriales bacterium]
MTTGSLLAARTPVAGRTTVPLLFLIADTGGGHRAAATAVRAALDQAHPGRFAPVLYDPLGGSGSAWLSRTITGCYGPLIRHAPHLYGALYRASDSDLAMRLLWSTVFAPAERLVAAAVREQRPAAIVSFHGLLSRPGVRAAAGRPMLTVITDLITPHAAFRYGEADRIVVPSQPIEERCAVPPDRLFRAGVPVGPGFWCGPQPRYLLRRRLGLPTGRFTVLLTGGAEGAGPLERQADALLRRYDDLTVVAICGRNQRLRRRLRPSSRLVVRGFVPDMADWMGAADVIVTKAGPQTIAEATACGTPMLISSHVPGQEDGNTEYCVRNGTARVAADPRRLVREIDRLRTDPQALAGMRRSAIAAGRPRAAFAIADLITEMVQK